MWCSSGRLRAKKEDSSAGAELAAAYGSGSPGDKCALRNVPCCRRKGGTHLENNVDVEILLTQLGDALGRVSPVSLVAVQVPGTDTIVSVATDKAPAADLVSALLTQAAAEVSDPAAVRDDFVREFRRLTAARRSGAEPDSLAQHETKPTGSGLMDEAWAQVDPSMPLDDQTQILVRLMYDAADLFDAPLVMAASVPETARTVGIRNELVDAPDVAHMLAAVLAGRARSRAQEREMLNTCLMYLDGTIERMK